MRKILLRALFFLIPFLWSIYVCSQPKKERDCSTSCFTSEVVSVDRTSDACTNYEMRVSFSGACAHALSHFSVAVPCGSISNIWNSQNWKQVVGTDPTTGLRGFKIDDISNFGEGSLSSFIVKFTVCATNEDCSLHMNCWQPQVAYKASTCVNYETLKVTCASSLKASLEKKDASCFGGTDGSLSVIVESGQEPYTFLWSDNTTSQSRSGLQPGNYSVTVRDASGAEVTLEEVISQPEKISISGNTTPASCNGAADGGIDITVSGGTGPYSFSWNNNLTTEDVVQLTSGQYTVTVTDEKNCSVTASFSIANTSVMNIAGTQVRPDCNSTNGSIGITVTGGTTPYSFVWSNGATEEDVANLQAGLYTVTVYDNSGCSQEKTFLLADNNTLTLRATTTPTSCTGDASGQLDLTVSGGTAPYSFSWSNNQTTEDLSGLSAGLYNVTVTDAKGCKASGAYVVSKTTFQVARSVVQPTCHGDDNGSITLAEPIGGTPPYTYEWSNGATGTTLTDLEPGIYTVTVTDATGCSRVVTSTISNPPQVTAMASVSNNECNSDGSFSIDLSTMGGTAPYTFAWSNGSATEDLTGLVKGTYIVVITDAHGCSVTKEVVVEGEGSDWSCLIDERATPVCGSAGNTLSTSLTDADSYSWTVESTDGNWSITNNTSPSISFTAGGENSSATFTLTVTKDDCTKTCSYTISACTPDSNGEDPGGEDPGGEDPGGEDPGGEDPGNGGEQTCEECFSTVARLVSSSGSCRTYEMEVSTNGLCRHDLSHWTVAIPCGTISDFWNSEGWKMEYGKDPTTGLYGLKVDDIGDFGKAEDSFTVRFTLCETTNCDLSYWDPTVAYKAGQCVGVETIRTSQLQTAAGRVAVYPNPFNDVVQFEWNASHDDVDLEIIDQYGNTVSRLTRPTGKGDKYYITLESSSIPKGMYYYRLNVDGETYNGKISKR